MERRFLSWFLFSCFALGLWTAGGCDQADSETSGDKEKTAAGSDADPSSKNRNKSTATNGAKSAKPKSSKPKKVEPDVNDDRFHDPLLEVVGEYLKYSMVNTNLGVVAPKVAPTLCGPAMPPVDDTLAPKMSEAETGHGKKLYFLFAKDVGHYANRGGTPSAVGQAIVKESWDAVPGNPDARNLRSHASNNRINPRVKIGDETLQIGRRKNLFVMLKTANDTPGTDEGWVYGIVDSDSKEVLAAGAVASCMNCHVDQQDRLFRDGIIDWDERAKALTSDEK